MLMEIEILTRNKETEASTMNDQIKLKNKEEEATTVVMFVTAEIALQLAPMHFNHPVTKGRSLGEVTEDLNLNLRV